MHLRDLLLFSLVACGAERAEGPAVVAVADPKGTPLVVGTSSSAPPPVAPPVRDEEGPVPIRAEDPRLGHDDARTTIVVFIDLQCPHCREVHARLAALQERTPSLRIVWKHYPLSSHPQARPAAEAAQGVYMLAGGAAFSTFAKKVLESPAPTRADFDAWAKEAGIPNAALARGLQAGKWAAAVEKDHADGERLKLVGVPTLYINGVLYKGNGSDESLQAEIDATQ